MLKRILTLIAVVALSAGCASTPDEEQSPAGVEDRAAQQPSQVSTPPDVRTVTPDEVKEGALPPELSDPRHILYKRSIYFDYDDFVVKEEYRPLIDAHSRLLVSRPNLKILIQGNTDERGSREYNLALGQKRADAVKRMMHLLGVREDQIEAVSLGEEKPRNPGQNEAAWAENRRADIIYAGE